jgi:hypothetical protein
MLIDALALVLLLLSLVVSSLAITSGGRLGPHRPRRR